MINKDLGSFIKACIANFAMFFAFYLLLPVTVAYLHTQLHASFLEIGLILSSNLVMAIAIRPFAGYLLDRFNRQKLLLISFMCFASCFLGYILAPNLAIFTIFRAIHGLTFSLTTVALNTVTIDAIPSDRREKWLDYYSIMSNVAMAVGPLIALFFFDQNHNFVELFCIAIGMSLVGSILSFTIKPHSESITNQSNNHNKTSNRSKFKISRPRIRPRLRWSLDRFFLKSGVWIAIVISTVSLSYGMLNTYITMYGNTVSGALSGSGVFFMYFAISMVVSRILTAEFLRKGHVKVLTNSSLSFLIISYTIFTMHASPLTFYISGVAMGLMYGILAPVLQSMISELATHRQRGTANATYLVSWDFGVGIGILLGGVITHIESLSLAFKVATMILLAGLILFDTIAVPKYLKKRKLLAISRLK